MSSADYAATPPPGKLKLKGVKGSKVTKKNKPTKDEKASEKDEDHSVMIRKLVHEDQEVESEETRMTQTGAKSPAEDEDADGCLGATIERSKTSAERKYDEQRRKRLNGRLNREGVKTHKQRVEELNRYLSGLSEHHDMPRIGPG